MRRKIQLKNESIETAGLSKDYKKCLAEYVWNAFDAEATSVNIIARENELGGLGSIEIIDNGNGINLQNISDTFGIFLASNKSKHPKWASIHGSKGKGRFSFISFASQAVWKTVYTNGNVNKEYSISINESDKDYFELTDEIIVERKTGTTVVISGINGITYGDILSKEFRKCFINIFAWFLYLNKDKNYSIAINDMEIDYSDIIDELTSEKLNIEIGSENFEIHFIKWIGKINERYYYYFLDNSMCERYKKYTSFNKSSIEFPHSVYIKSGYFDDFEVANDNIAKEQLSYIKSQRDTIFLELIKELKGIIEDKRKQFIKFEAPKIIQKFNKEGVMPKFKANKYDVERKKDLEEVVSEIYCIQPKIFQRSNIEQKKSIIGFLNLLLDSDEREGIINIIDNISSLTPQERQDLNNILVKTDFSRIIRTIKMIENRYKVIEALKKLVYELNKFTNERDHIQKVIESNYWLFGEQYNLVTADKNFEKALKGYIYALDGFGSNDEYTIENKDRLRRPDIFMARSRYYEMPNSVDSEENIIVELKQPSVVLNKKIFRQIEDYMDLIINHNRFNSTLRKWKFIMVSTTVDDYIKSEYNNWKDKGRAFLIKGGDKYEIYAMTWDDVFKSFDIKHRYLLDKLQMNKSIIEDELEAKGIDMSREGANKLTDELLQVNAR